MNFYKLTLVGDGKDIYVDGKDIYVNPKSIMCYTYEENNVNIFLSGGYVTVSAVDFTNMMILEGVDEYWNTQPSIEFQ